MPLVSKDEPHAARSIDSPGSTPLSRRSLLKGAAAMAAGAGFAASVPGSLVAQVTGSMPGGGTVPLRLPMGALNYLDQNEYISNMEIISFTPGLTASGGEPLTTMWARGKERAIPGAGGFVSITDPRKPFAMGPKTLNGGLVSVAYQTATKKWLAVTAAASPLTDTQYPRGKYDPANAAASTSFTDCGASAPTRCAIRPGRICCRNSAPVSTAAART